jgi:hypothetical protein
VTTYPKTEDYDLEEDLTQLGIGEAMVTILSERGAPTPVVWTRMQPPTSLMAAVPTDQVDAAAHADPLWPRYAEEIDRESAREKLTAKLAPAPEAAPAPAAPAKAAKPRQGAGKGARKGAGKGARKGKARSAPADAGSPVVDFLKSREGRSAASAVTRGAMGVLKGFMK